MFNLEHETNDGYKIDCTGNIFKITKGELNFRKVGEHEAYSFHGDDVNPAAIEILTFENRCRELLIRIDEFKRNLK